MFKKLNSLPALALLIIIISMNSSMAAAQESVATVNITATEVTWQPLSTDYSSLTLTIVGPNEFYSQQSFAPGSLPAFGLLDSAGQPHPDGSYTYELILAPALSPEAAQAIAQATEEERAAVAAALQEAGQLPEPLTQTGYFSIAAGALVLDTPEEGGIGVLDQVIQDDQIVTGSICVGFDCGSGESFGVDTIRLKEHNLRIHFDDTSYTGTFPRNDWRIVVNDRANGGASYFRIEDSTAGRNPFTIRAGAPTNALYVDASGRVGLGTGAPAQDLHIVYGDTPTIRLDQSGGPWTPQTWEIAGNEANFFIKDVTHSTSGEKLVFRIKPNAPTNSIFVAADGKVGLGSSSPYANLHVYQSGTATTDGLLVGQSSSVYNLRLDSSGNLMIDGVLTESSDVNAKENISPVDRREILAQLAELEISTWQYKDDQTPVRHIGPMAQDFYAAFAVGQDDTHIASLDATGVALAAIQELHRVSQEKDAQIAELEARVAALEKLVESMVEP